MADHIFEGAARLLSVGIDFYHAQQMKEKRRKLEALKAKWVLPRGTILVLKDDIYLKEDHGGIASHKWFDVGYAPMLLEVHWPKLAEGSQTQDSIIFHLWCSGVAYVYVFRPEKWESKLPFEVLVDESI